MTPIYSLYNPYISAPESWVSGLQGSGLKLQLLCLKSFGQGLASVYCLGLCFSAGIQTAISLQSYKSITLSPKSYTLN